MILYIALLQQLELSTSNLSFLCYKLQLLIGGVIIAWNVVVFALYGIDKYKSMHNKWRIPEVTLILASFLMGGIGSIIGMVVFHHKISKVKFKILVPLALVFNFVVIIGSAYLETDRIYKLEVEFMK